MAYHFNLIDNPPDEPETLQDREIDNNAPLESEDIEGKAIYQQSPYLVKYTKLALLVKSELETEL